MENHQPKAEQAYKRTEEKVNTPLSAVDAIIFHNFIEEEKQLATEILGDIRDAKRRISAAKGPKKRRAPEKDESGSGDEEGEGEDD